MPKGYSESAGSYLEYGAAGCLFPIDELDATVLQYRDAELALNDVDGSDVIVVAPTSLATSIYLGEHALTAILIGSLPTSVRTRLADELDTPLAAFELIQISKWHSDSPNRSLAEFAEV